MEDDDSQLSGHIRHLLLDYVHTHLAIDHVQYTQLAVAELLPRNLVPLHDPSSLTLPADPFKTLNTLLSFASLPTYQEKFSTTQDACLLLKGALSLPKGPPKSERLSWPVLEVDDSGFYHVETILTRRAVRETPVLGKGAGERRCMSSAIPKHYASMVKAEPIALKPVEVQPILEPPVRMDQVLNVTYHIKAPEHASVRALLKAVSTMSRPSVPKPDANVNKDSRSSYLPASFFSSSSSHSSHIQIEMCPDSPPLVPIFARSSRQKKDEGTRTGGALHSMSEIPGYIGASGYPATEVDAEEALALKEKEKEHEARELARQSMVIVDGWQAYATSSPSTISSLSVEDEIDELIDMFPSSPDTSVLGSGGYLETLTRDVEESKLDEILIPRERRIGGVTAGKRERIVDRARKAGGLGPFLAPLLGVVGPTPPASATNDTDKETGNDALHPLLHEKLASIKPLASEDNTKDRPNNDLKNGNANELAGIDIEDSMLGQPTALSSIPEDIEIRALYQDLSPPLSGEKATQKQLLTPRLGPSLPRTVPDPRALIRDEKLFDDDDEDKSGPDWKEQGQKEGKGLRLLPMTVPPLCAPNVDASPSIKGFRELLPIQPGAAQANEEGKAPTTMTKPQQPMRFLKCVKGIASLRVALSWIPFTRTNPIPAHTEILEADLFHSQGGTNPEALQNDARALLARLGLDPVEDREADARYVLAGCEFDEARWRGVCSGLSGAAGGEYTASFFPEIEIILTRRERGALNAREGRVLMQDDNKNTSAAGGVEVNPGSTRAVDEMEGHTSYTSADKRTFPCPHELPVDHEENADRYGLYRPAKRPRLTLDVNNDSGIGMMLDQITAATDQGRCLLDFQNGLMLDEDEGLNFSRLQDQDVLDSTLIDVNDSLAQASQDPSVHCEEESSDASAHGYFDGSELITASAYDDNLRYCDDQEQMDFSIGHDAGGSFEPLSLSYDSQAYLAFPALHSQVCGTHEVQNQSQEPDISYWARPRRVLGDIHAGGGRQIASATLTTALVEDDVMSESDDIGPRATHAERPANDAATASVMSLKTLDLDLARHALGIEAFAMLRARRIVPSTAPQASSVSAPLAHSPVSASSSGCDQQAQKVENTVPRTVPPEIFDRKTLRLGSSWTIPGTIHRYMASLDLLQKRVLVRSLESSECLVELIEREALEGADLIIDPHTAVMFTSLLSLPAHNKKLVATLSAQTWRYKRVLVVFEAYPASRSFKAGARKEQKQGYASVEPELWAYTPPIMKALKRFRRDLDMAEGWGKKAVGCEVWYAFADSVQDAAAYARWFGNEAEEVDYTDGAVWGGREWLDLEVSEDEAPLALLGGMNRFSASIILCQMGLQQFIDLDPASRLAIMGPFIGREAIDVFNLDIEQRMQAFELETHQSDDDVNVDVSPEYSR